MPKPKQKANKIPTGKLIDCKKNNLTETPSIFWMEKTAIAIIQKVIIRELKSLNEVLIEFYDSQGQDLRKQAYKPGFSRDKTAYYPEF